VAVNIDPSESDLEKVDEAWLVGHFGSDRIRVANSLRDTDTSATAAGTSGLWRALLFVVLGLLALETALAQRFSRADRLATAS